jgi:hypothetical protein
MNCLVSGCQQGDVSTPMPGLSLCYAHYTELWAHLDTQKPEHQNWPGSEPVIRAWVQAKQNLKKPENEVRHVQNNR